MFHNSYYAVDQKKVKVFQELKLQYGYISEDIYRLREAIENQDVCLAKEIINSIQAWANANTNVFEREI